MLAHFDYMSFMAEFGRQITDVTEFQTRLAAFSQVHNLINDHNATGASWVAGHNQFSDWTHAEYKAMLGYVADESVVEEPVWFEETNSSPIDWRALGAINTIQDQAQCGSCWAFSATFAFEAAHHNATGTLEKFSEQQLVSCAGARYGNFGCNGGMQNRAYNYLKKHEAISQVDYPYTSMTGTTGDCESSGKATTGVKVLTSVQITKNNVDQMKAGLAKSALAVSIEADQPVFQAYKSGVFDSEECGTSIDHAVGVVGWGVDSDSGSEYWILRNSWGSVWGDAGYMKVKIVEGKGICGVQTGPLYPTAN